MIKHTRLVVLYRNLTDKIVIIIIMTIVIIIIIMIIIIVIIIIIITFVNGGSAPTDDFSCQNGDYSPPQQKFLRPNRFSSAPTPKLSRIE